MARLYGPLQAWFDKTWRPGEIEPVTAPPPSDQVTVLPRLCRAAGGDRPKTDSSPEPGQKHPQHQCQQHDGLLHVG